MSELNFKPAHDGMGFHPFSSGLPYAPAPGATGPGFTARITRPAEPHSKPLVQAQVTVEMNFGWTYLLSRTLAYGLDWALATITLTAGLLFSLYAGGVDPTVLIEGSFFLVTFGMLMTFSWALIAGQEIAFQTTLGKKIFGLRLRGTPSAILIRSILFVLNFLLGGFGLAWALFHRDKRCWHDIAVDLQPTRCTSLGVSLNRSS